ncbi:exosortase-associated EpsI family protein [Pirellulales bacterium]|nr:exosortase-associated EpsI family protein [Pirellulales bacterium]
MSQPDHFRSGQFDRRIAIALVIAVALVVSSGVLYGRYSQRWGPPPDLIAAGKYLKTMPSQIGVWQLAEEKEMRKSVRRMLECAGYVNRRYVNQETGAIVSVSIIVGPPGPTAVHTPEICYSSRAHELTGARRRELVGGAGPQESSFWSVDFRAKNPLAEGLRVHYAWSRGERWAASKSPRYEFAAAPLLYKLQLAASRDTNADDAAPDAGKQFLAALLGSDWALHPKTSHDN